MRILYAAIDQAVPAAHGGAVHVQSVAEGLTALGHDVMVLASRGDRDGFPTGSVEWRSVPPPLGDRRLRLLRAGDVLRFARDFRADVVIERYYNFGGEGLLAARRIGALGVLEVNAPVVDYPGSLKQRLDRVMIVQPLRRWRDWQCRMADLIVTPTAKILPSHVPSSRILQTEWGADTDRFRPGASGPTPFSRLPGHVVAVFVGAFRPWHGAIQLVRAVRELQARGGSDVQAVLIGAGPELSRIKKAAEGMSGVAFTGPLAHDHVPAALAAADIGVAPFDISAHAPLRQAFYWSPLKVFEYMASGLPVVVPRIDRLSHIVRDGLEGVLYDPDEPGSLANALEQLRDGSLRTKLGQAARARAVEHFSWRSHCVALDRAIRAAQDAHSHRH